MENTFHTPVLVDEVLRYFLTATEGIYVDGTLGGGGHAEAIATHMSPRCKLIGFDVDADALSFARNRLKRFGENIMYIHENFSNLKRSLDKLGINKINGLLLDLGVSSHQLNEAQRGFSFQVDGRIDMRMNHEQELDGWKVVNTYDQDQLSAIFWKYGEERNSRRIAKKIVNLRKSQPLNTTEELSTLVESAVGKKFLKKSLARIFQAIRIEVNNELQNLQKALCDALEIMQPGGRLVVLSYHSLEDRIVKEFLKEESKQQISFGNKYLMDQPRIPQLKVLTQKPITASNGEIGTNPRARSAKLRAAERI